MGNIFQWVGGHTGYTGPNSGFSVTGGGTGGQLPRWTNPISGATSDIGDLWFGPYYWGNIRNWRIAVAATGQAGAFSYSIPNRFPKSSDSVYFNNGYTAQNGTFIPTYAVSCLYGGMSGDGFTASGSTGWYGATGGTSVYAAAAHGDIYITVDPSFTRKTFTPFGLDSGQLGTGANSYGDFDSFTPLTIRTSNFTFMDGATSASAGARIAVNNIGGGTVGSPYFFMTSGVSAGQYYGVAMVKGKFEQIVHQSGSLFATDITVNNVGYWSAQGYLNKFGSSNTNAMANYYIVPSLLREDSYIWGAYGTQANMTINGYSGPSGSSTITLGSFNDGGNPTITSLSLGAGTGPGANNGPTVRLSSVQIEELKMNAGNLGISPLATRFDYPIIRDGYIKGSSVLNMAHPTDVGFQNFLLGYSPNDNGLRVDSADVVIKCYVGESLKTGATEGYTGFSN